MPAGKPENRLFINALPWQRFSLPKFCSRGTKTEFSGFIAENSQNIAYRFAERCLNIMTFDTKQA
jgi:hypothetical protein